MPEQGKTNSTLASPRGAGQVYRAGYMLFKAFVDVLLDTGMRRDELLKLAWGQIDFVRNIIMIEKSKNKQVREIPMCELSLNRGFYDFEPHLLSSVQCFLRLHRE